MDIVRLAGNKIDLCVIRTDEEAITAYTKWQNDETINMWFGANDCITQYAEEVEWANNAQNKNNRFCIVDKETRKLIGTCAVGCYDGISAYISILIGEPCGQNKGYGTEVIKMLVKFAFNQLNAHRVALTVVSENERAIKCYTKAGFVECGREHEATYYNGHYCDNITMEILRKNWNEEG